mmetsp:Transcript_19007/g.39700  ORF Transcript_19007/g.39700 Transcript_19007/m.39700 type:complete len:398 (-) Transcript_19007:125-1318(-)
MAKGAQLLGRRGRGGGGATLCLSGGSSSAPMAGRPVVGRRAPGSGWAARAGSDGASTSSNSDASVGANGTKGKGKVGTKQKEASLALGSLDFELEAPAKVEEAQRSARTQESAAQQLASGRQIVSLRTQLTGGIQSTNVNIDLPEPQVAVRNLLEYARHAHMSTVMSKAQHRRADYPFGSIVEFAVDGSGYPVFAMSSLAIHTRNVLANPRCAIQVHAPGWTGLNNARVTLFGDLLPVAPECIKDAADLFNSKREKMNGVGPSSSLSRAGGGLTHSVKKGAQNNRYFVMAKIVDVLFVGGYGTVKWIKPKDYVEAEPDFILLDLANTIRMCNARFSQGIREILPEADDVVFISVDMRGVEIRVREGTEDSVRRLIFNKHCFTMQDVADQLQELIVNE